MKHLRDIQLGITHKLLILFLLFLLIFYGTLLVLFTNTQKIVAVSELIVSKNNEIATLSKAMYENLLSMEVNDKKFQLLKKDTYKKYFQEAKHEFELNLENVLALESTDYQVAPVWKGLAGSYHNHLKSVGTTGSEQVRWASEDRINEWLATISDARRKNEADIEEALLDINRRGRSSVRNGLIGMGITIIAGIAAALFLARSILHPLKVLKQGLKNISSEKDFEEIQINRQDEFGELAAAFNDMSRQLKDEEELRSEFIATLSHEIRTPLSSIRESVNMLLEGVLGSVNEKQQKFLDIAQSEIFRIGDLLKHLLQVSRLDSESRKVTPILIDPNKLVLEVSRSLIPPAKAKKVAMKLHKMADPPVVIGVKKELQQVLYNLLENAIKFSPRAGEVTIQLFVDENGESLTYQIADQGPGVTEQEESLIFSKYYRAKNARNHVDGVGLGLSISKRIIQFHGGELYVKNNDDGGCSFYCSLPCEVDTKAA